MKKVTEGKTLILKLVKKWPGLIATKQEEIKFIREKSPSKYKCKLTLEQFKAKLMVKINHENPIKGNKDNISRVSSEMEKLFRKSHKAWRVKKKKRQDEKDWKNVSSLCNKQVHAWYYPHTKQYIRTKTSNKQSATFKIVTATK